MYIITTTSSKLVIIFFRYESLKKDLDPDVFLIAMYWEAKTKFVSYKNHFV